MTRCTSRPSERCGNSTMTILQQTRPWRSVDTAGATTGGPVAAAARGVIGLGVTTTHNRTIVDEFAEGIPEIPVCCDTGTYELSAGSSSVLYYRAEYRIYFGSICTRKPS